MLLKSKPKFQRHVMERKKNFFLPFFNNQYVWKQALVKFMAKIRGNRINFDSKNLVLTAGDTSANEILMFCLVNPGEAFLLPTPYYPAYVFFIAPMDTYIIIIIKINTMIYSYFNFYCHLILWRKIKKENINMFKIITIKFL